MSDETDIRTIIAEHAKALYAKDADALLAHNDAGLIAFQLDPPLEHRGSPSAIKAQLEAWFATWKDPIGWDERDVALTIGGNVAFSTSLVRLTGTKTGGGAENSVWFRCTRGYRKHDGAWKIAHLHESVPFYMDGSFKAAVDLQP